MNCDAATFSKMYEGIYQDLYRYALCLMKNQQEAEDVVSEAVLSAYEHIGKLRDKEAFKSWMFTILSNACKKRLKTLQRSQCIDIEEVEIQGKSPDIGLSLDVKKAFDILTDEEQMIVGLSVFGGYNSKEIGTILKLRAGTVRVKRKRALDKMKDHL